VNAVLVDQGAPEACRPLTCSRPLAAIPVGNVPLATVQSARLQEAGLAPIEDGGPGDVYVRGDAWLSRVMLKQLAALKAPAGIKDEAGDLLAWIGVSASAVLGATWLTADADSFLIRYPWDVLRVNECVLREVTAGRVEGEVSPGATLEGTLVLGKGSRILPGVYIEGTVVIGEDCKIGPNCYLRGGTSIGDRCHVGQAVEIKNSLIMSGASIGHLSYCGDSVIGENVNFGAGTITANFRHDGRNHRSRVGGKALDTGRRKFGAIVADGVHTGIHTSLYPGRKLWPGTSTLPGAIVKDDVEA
jgi:bifunctional UDP-N-acetylglucosamine pyrophosphorylase/glucosamine-1-phosphate N-acetyltransferase